MKFDHLSGKRHYSHHMLALVAYHNLAAPCRSPPGDDFGYPAFTDVVEIPDVMITVKRVGSAGCYCAYLVGLS